MKKTFYCLGLSLLLFGCSGDDKESTVNEAGIIANIKTTNFVSTTFPWNAINTANGKLKRWDFENDGPIPVKTGNNALAIEAMDEIEAELGMIIFDRTSIANTPNEEITRGMIVSVGTAIGPGGIVDSNTCGMVSGGIGTTSYPNGFYNEMGKINTVLYVHLSSAQCDSDLDVAIHEFGHALGLGAHFKGFGDGPAINNNFWNVLFNIYTNNIGDTEQDLDINKIK